MSKILIGMSGGVDSSVAAALLIKQNHNVTGTTLLLYDSTETEKSIYDAKKVSEILGISHTILDFRQEFKKYVLDYFVREYINARTPNPCIMCNKFIKFGFMLDKALKLGYDFVATGHYAQIKYNNIEKIWMLKKSNFMKDQSYFLYKLDQNQLKHIIFPLENLTKPEVRDLAKKYNLPVSEKKDSQDICFIKGQNYKKFIKNYNNFQEYINNSLKSGDFIDIDNNCLGTHKGFMNYTIGQRKKLEISLGKRIYVTKINSKTNEVTLGDYCDGAKKCVTCTDFNFVNKKIIYNSQIFAKLRSVSKLIPCKIFFLENNMIQVILEQELYFPAPGQSIVFYDNFGYVLGGATIFG